MKLSLLILTISALATLPVTVVSAQNTPSHEVVGASQPSQTANLQGASADETWFSEAQLDQMLAPVALYPDSVLTHVLIAATYPLEVVEADRWRQQNLELDAESALNAVEDQPWDASVKALVAFPHLLARMSLDLRWTQDLGDAFLISEAAVMDRVQSLRSSAYEAGELKTTEQVRIIVEKETIIIEPAVERVVYLPYYDTRLVYGHWRWSSYPPIYWDPFYPSVYHRHSVYWGPAVRVTPSFYIGAFYWSQRHVVVVNHYNYFPQPVFYNSRSLVRHNSAKRWQHQPTHRRGVAYHPVYETRYPERVERRTYQDRSYSRPVVDRDIRRDTSRDMSSVRSAERPLQSRRAGDAGSFAAPVERDRSAVSSFQQLRSGQEGSPRTGAERQPGVGTEQQRQRTTPQSIANQPQRVREPAVVRQQPQRTQESTVVRQRSQRTQEPVNARQQPQRTREQAVVTQLPQRAREQTFTAPQPQRSQPSQPSPVARQQPQRVREQAVVTQLPQRATSVPQPQGVNESAMVRQPQRGREPQRSQARSADSQHNEE